MTRDELLEQYGRFYGEQHFAVTFTASTVGDDAKRVTARGWDKTQPLADGEYGASYIAGRGVNRNPAIVLRPSNLIVLECDTEDDLVRIQGLDLPTTLTVRSSKPYKRHYYFRPAPELEALPYVAFRFESGKLTADSGRYFLAPPSIHPTGATYAFLPELGPAQVEIATLPERVYRELAQQARLETTELRDAISDDPDAKIRAGNRRDLIFRYACMLRRWGLPRAAIAEQCHAFNAARCDPPVERHLVEIQVDGAMKKHGGQELAGQNGNAGESQPDPWAPLNLAELPEQPPVQPTLGGLGIVYPGKRHVFSGPQESAKTLAAYAIGLQVVRHQGRLMLIDFEMGPWDARNRMRDLGAGADDFQRILYIEPSQPATLTTAAALLTYRPDLVIIDAAAGAFDLQGLDDNKRQDVEKFTSLYVRAFWKAGVATIVLDHVVKNAEARGKYAVGSERKVGGADVHLGFEVITPISRGTNGLYKIVTHKDRGGFLKRGALANLKLSSDNSTHAITWEFDAAEQTDEEHPFRPTRLMEKVSIYLELRPERTATRGQIEEDVTGRAGFIRKAIDALVADDYASEIVGGKGKATTVTLTTPYRENNDSTRPRPTSSHLVPDAVNEPRPTSSPTTVGTGRGDGPPDDVTSSLFDDSEPELLDDERSRWFE